MHWIIQTRAGFTTRLCAGVLFFLILAIVDLRKNGRTARRWREYLFLIFCVCVAIVYGVLNDQITSRLSWEYYYYGKQLEPILGPQIPPEPLALSIQAAKIGAMATWSVGVILGAVLLIANNPRKNGPPPLAFSRLCRLLIPILSITIALAIVFGFLGWFGFLNSFSSDFLDLWQLNLWRPHHFMCAWGAHLGGYVGGLIGGIFAIVRVLQIRRGRRTTALSARVETV